MDIDAHIITEDDSRRINDCEYICDYSISIWDSLTNWRRKPISMEEVAKRYNNTSVRFVNNDPTSPHFGSIGIPYFHPLPKNRFRMKINCGDDNLVYVDGSDNISDFDLKGWTKYSSNNSSILRFFDKPVTALTAYRTDIFGRVAEAGDIIATIDYQHFTFYEYNGHDDLGNVFLTLIYNGEDGFAQSKRCTRQSPFDFVIQDPEIKKAMLLKKISG